MFCTINEIPSKLLSKGTITYDGKIGTRFHFCYQLGTFRGKTIFNKMGKDFILMVAWYINRNKTVQEAQKTINSQFEKENLKDKIVDVLTNPPEPNFYFVVPLFQKEGIYGVTLHVLKSRIAKLI